MTESQILLLIQTVIIANGNNEITADVLRPVLIEMLQQPNALIGDLDTLQTSDKTNLVNAINEVLGTNTGGLTILTGTTDPNVTPPIGTINIGDFYIWNDGTLKGFYQYNGSEWAIIKNLNIPNDLISSDAANGVEVGSDGKLFVNKFSESIPIENTYATIDGVGGMLDSQGQQTTGFIQKVLDASFDGITGIAYYEKKSSSTANLSDYDRINQTAFVNSVTGDGVNNADPKNPVIDLSSYLLISNLKEESIKGSAKIALTASGAQTLNFNTYAHGHFNLTGVGSLTITDPTLAVGETVVRSFKVVNNGFAFTIPARILNKLEEVPNVNDTNFYTINYVQLEVGNMDITVINKPE